MTEDIFDIAVIGGGLAGHLAALAAAREGWRVALVAPPAPDDRRTTALLSESIAMLDGLGLWEPVRPEAAALATMRIIDGTRRLFRAPPVSFHAAEIGLEAFGYNIPNAPLLAAAADRVGNENLVSRIPHALVSARHEEDAVHLVLADGTQISALAVLAADGRKSTTRESAGIDIRQWSYPQTAVVLNFAHRFGHENISTEFHTEAGPFTQVPLPGNRSSLVWAMAPDEVDRVMALSREALNGEVERRMHSILGAVDVEDGTQAFPMSSLIARHFGKGRVFLVGETGHAFPPIGAQGLNLGLRDIDKAIERLRQAGGPAHAKAAALSYDQARRLDVSSRTFGVDLLNRTLLSDLVPAQLLRAGGLAAIGSITPLKIFAMREGMTPGWRGFSLRRTMRDRLREKVRR